MTRRPKALGAALVALFALFAMATPPAQAVKHHFTVPAAAPSLLTGFNEDNTKFEIQLTGGARKLTCETNFDATNLFWTSTELTLTPTFGECEVPGVDPNVDVDVNHCTTILKGETDVNGDAPVRLECAAGDEITITYKVAGAQCVVHIPPQTPSGGAHYTQLAEFGKKKELTAKFTLAGIKYKETGGPFFCPVTHEGGDGSLTGAMEMLARKHEKANCFELSGTSRTTPGNYLNECEGADVDLELTTTLSASAWTEGGTAAPTLPATASPPEGRPR